MATPFAQLDASDLTGLWRRIELHRRVGKLRTGLSGILRELAERKSLIIENAPEGSDAAVTQYVVDHFRMPERQRERLTAFLRQAYPTTPEETLERRHDAELYNRARHVYSKTGGLVHMGEDELVRRAAIDRREKNIGIRTRAAGKYTPPLRRTVPISSGIGFSYAWRTHGDSASRYRDAPTYLFAHSTSDHLWVTALPIPPAHVDRILSYEDPVELAEEFLHRESANLEERHPLSNLELRVTLHPAEREFSF